MSFELFVDSISDGPGVSRDDLRRCFGVRPVEEEPGTWRFEYGPPGNHFILFLTADESDPERIISLCVWRPIDEERFWEGLLWVMRACGFFVYFAGDCPPLVAQESHIGRVPEGYVEALGQPICVANRHEMGECIRNA